MYASLPTKMDTTPQVMGNQLTFDVIDNSQEVPQRQKEFIEKLGWTHAGYHGASNEELFKKLPPNGCTDEVRNGWAHDLSYNYWHWYEAVAYEFTKFMGITDDSGEGNPNMSSAGAASSQQHK